MRSCQRDVAARPRKGGVGYNKKLPSTQRLKQAMQEAFLAGVPQGVIDNRGKPKPKRNEQRAAKRAAIVAQRQQRIRERIAQCQDS